MRVAGVGWGEWLGVGSVGGVRCVEELGGDVSESDGVKRARFTARHAGFRVWVRWDLRYLECVNVCLHPAQCVADMIVVSCRLRVSV